jgi:glutaredoxin
MMVRCEKHDLACGQTGQCVLCRREESREAGASSRRWLIGFLTAVVIVVGSGVTYRLSRPSTSATPPIAGALVVVVYTTSWCPVCKRAKTWLNSSGVAYEERDVESSRTYAREMGRINPRGSVPTIALDGDVMVGFSENKMASMLERAVQRRSASGPL